MTPESKPADAAATAQRDPQAGWEDELDACLRVRQKEVDRWKAQAEANAKDAARLALMFKHLEWDGLGWWLPDLCIKDAPTAELDNPIAPTVDEFRAAIDAAMTAKD